MTDRDDKRRPGEIDPDAPVSAEEVLASQRLRDALAQAGGPTTTADADVVALLRSAWSPEALDEGEHAGILDEVPTAEELELAAELRDALADDGPRPEVVVALQSAFRPESLREDEHRAIVARALDERRGAEVVPFAPRARRKRAGVAAATTFVAVAAGILLWMTNGGPDRTASRPMAPLARTRSTEALFGEPFKAGETSARIDRIAMARASDYRDNRFAKWGVR